MGRDERGPTLLVSTDFTSMFGETPLDEVETKGEGDSQGPESEGRLCWGLCTSSRRLRAPGAFERKSWRV